MSSVGIFPISNFWNNIQLQYSDAFKRTVFYSKQLILSHPDTCFGKYVVVGYFWRKLGYKYCILQKEILGL